MEFLLPELVVDQEDLALPRQTTKIQSFYAGNTVFITGATGFLGKVLLEKLLRSCPDVTKIYILVRLKYHYTTHNRLDEIFEGPLFEYLRETRPSFREKVELIRGDLCSPNLGISFDDLEKLSQETNVIFHCGSASSEAKMKLAAEVNVRALKDLIGLARKMKDLKAFIHVSTLYANCQKNVLDEEFHKPFVSSGALLEVVSSMDPISSNPITLGRWPNNHLFTKCVAEDIIKNEAKLLPVAIIRPSIVVSTAKQPMPGWVDNMGGPSGLVMTIYLGLTKTILARKENVADVVPADYVASLMMAAAWDVANSKSLNDNKEIVSSMDKIPIYNVTSTNNYITWGKFFELTAKYGRKIPSTATIWYPWHVVQANQDLHRYLVILLHYIPALTFDFVIYFFSKESKYLGYYTKIDSLLESLTFYTMNAWEVKMANANRLWMKMEDDDRHLFNFDVNSLDWELYFFNYIRGIRVYILKDGLDTLSEGIRIYQKQKVLLLAAAACLLICLVYFFN